MGHLNGLNGLVWSVMTCAVMQIRINVIYLWARCKFQDNTIDKNSFFLECGKMNFRAIQLYWVAS